MWTSELASNLLEVGGSERLVGQMRRVVMGRTWVVGGLVAALACVATGCGGDELPDTVGSSSSALTVDPGSSSLVMAPATPSSPQGTLVLTQDGLMFVAAVQPGQAASDSSPDPIPARPTETDRSSNPDVKHDSRDAPTTGSDTKR